MFGHHPLVLLEAQDPERCRQRTQACSPARLPVTAPGDTHLLCADCQSPGTLQMKLANFSYK